MSLLAPLYLMGALAIAAPVIFHLIRRQVKRRTPISSMMFLPITQPKLSRRSRLENLPLLLLRALALLLLALAFSRPFLRSSTTAEVDGASRRVVVMVDGSASMRRDDLWDQAIKQLGEVTESLQSGDSLAIVSFDSEPRLRLSLDASAEMSIESLRTVGVGLFNNELPSWRHTDLGAALRFVVDLATANEADASESIGEPVMVEDSGSSELVASDGTAGTAASVPSVDVKTQVVLISDMQSGASLDALQGMAWPRNLPVEVRRVATRENNNAWITLPSEQEDIAGVTNPESPMEASDSGRADQRFRLRVSNSAQSDRARFQFRWVQQIAKASGDGDSPSTNATDLAVEVPPGQSRIVRIAYPPADTLAIELMGDQHDFDNRRYTVSQPPIEQTLLLVGDDGVEPRDSLFYYLERLSFDSPRRKVVVRQATSAASETLVVDQIPLVVAVGEINVQLAAQLRRYVDSGGDVVYVIPSAKGNDIGEKSLRLLTGSDQWTVSEAEVRDYVMLSRIDFSDPLFLPFADPKFNDFSKIRFWAHRTLSEVPPDWKTVASFENSSPAILQGVPVGEASEVAGRIWVFAAGWQPIESQLALSTKFIPLIFGLFEGASRLANQQSNDKNWTVGDSIATLVAADQKQVELLRAAEAESAQGGWIAEPMAVGAIIERPGVYRVDDGDLERLIAVNIAESESQTEPLADDDLERMGVVIGRTVPAELEAQSQRQLRDVELESQQRLWRWLLIGVLGLLALETLVGGWLGRSRSTVQEAL